MRRFCVCHLKCVDGVGDAMHMAAGAKLETGARVGRPHWLCK
jgi:hypothetical protein